MYSTTLTLIPRLQLPWLILSAVCLTGCGVHTAGEFAKDITSIRISSELSGRLYLPTNSSPYPLILDLHGCDGIMPARDSLWFPKFNAAGFAVLQLDSFSRRGVNSVCNDVFRVPPMLRSMDVALAIRWVLRDARFDPDNIFLIGMSHGGTSSLLTQMHSDSIFSRLNGVVALYPYCFDTLPSLNSDLLILIGEADDWTPASRCQNMKVLDYGEHDYELVVYPNVYHSYDVPGLNAVYLGHRVKYDEVAAKASVIRVLDFIRERAFDR